MDNRLKAEIERFRLSLEGKSLDDLREDQVDLGRKCGLLNQEKNKLRIKLDIVKARMEELRGNGDIGISDHAVLRYLERHKGLDVCAVRHEIRALIGEKRVLRRRKAEEIPIGDGVIAVITDRSIVATIYKDESEESSNDTA